MQAPTINMDPSIPRPPIVIDTAPPPLPSRGPMRPIVVYLNNSAEGVARALESTASAVNATLKNVTQRVASAAENITGPLDSNATLTKKPMVARTTTAASTSAAHNDSYWDDLNKMTTTSVSENASRLSIVHLLAWLMLFATLMMTTVVLLNWCLRSRQSAADAEEEEEGEEMRVKTASVPSSGSTQGTLAEGPTSASSSSSRLLASRGNLARQQFLESRKANGGVKDYGGTSSQ